MIIVCPLVESPTNARFAGRVLSNLAVCQPRGAEEDGAPWVFHRTPARGGAQARVRALHPVFRRLADRVGLSGMSAAAVRRDCLERWLDMRRGLVAVKTAMGFALSREERRLGRLPTDEELLTLVDVDPSE